MLLRYEFSDVSAKLNCFTYYSYLLYLEHALCEILEGAVQSRIVSLYKALRQIFQVGVHNWRQITGEPGKLSGVQSAGGVTDISQLLG